MTHKLHLVKNICLVFFILIISMIEPVHGQNPFLIPSEIKGPSFFIDGIEFKLNWALKSLKVDGELSVKSVWSADKKSVLIWVGELNDLDAWVVKLGDNRNRKIFKIDFKFPSKTNFAFRGPEMLEADWGGQGYEFSYFFWDDFQKKRKIRNVVYYDASKDMYISMVIRGDSLLSLDGGLVKNNRKSIKEIETNVQIDVLDGVSTIRDIHIENGILVVKILNRDEEVVEKKYVLSDL